MKKEIYCLIVCISVILLFNGCDWGNEYIKIEIVNYPDKMNYQVDIDSNLDLSGGKVKLTTRGGHAKILDMDGKNETGSSHFIILHDIDFNKKGIYIVKISRHKDLFCKFTIEVK